MKGNVSSTLTRRPYPAPINPLGLGWRSLLVFVVAALLVGACSAWRGAPEHNVTVVGAQVAGDPTQGWQALQEYGCHSCHNIPGVPGANSYVGPPLTAWAERTYIAGMLPNTPDNLISFLQHPQAFRPSGAMPNMGVTLEDARDMSAYLYTLSSNDRWNWQEALRR